MTDSLERLRAALADRYAIDRELGHGGMATVYLAQDLRHHRPVALKVLHPELAAALGSERFLREIEIAARLIHPHILPLHDSGEAAGFLYYVMPYIEGESLRQRLEREKQLPLGDALGIAREVADALDYAHRHGVVHRDIKPENILLEERHAVVADFGIARAITAAGGDKLTETGLAVGTPAYMSPEQAAGGGQPDGRSDIYSLACVLYEMLAGEPPYTGPTAQAIIAKRFADPVPRLRSVRDTIPDVLDLVVTKALAKVPADRYASAAEFAQALTAVEGLPPSAARPIGLAQPRAPARLLAYLGAAVLAIGAGYGLLSLVRGRGSATADDRRAMLVVLPFQNLGPPEDEYFAEGITEEITARLAGISGLGVIARTSAVQYRSTSKSIKQIGEELGVGYLLEGTIRWQRSPQGPHRVRVTPQLIRVSDGTHLWAQVYDEALSEVFQVQSAIAEQVTQALNVTLLAPERQALAAKPTDNLDAYEHYLRATNYRVRSYGERDTRLSIEDYERAVQLDPSFALAYAWLAEQHAAMYWFFYDRSAARLTQAQEAADRAAELAPDLAETHMARGYLSYWGHRDYSGALEHLGRARRVQPSNAEVLAAMGYVHRRQGEWDQAVADLTEASRLDPRSAIMSLDLGTTYTYQRRYAEAQRYQERAVELSPDFVIAYARLAETWLLQGNVERFRQVLHAAASRLGVETVLGESLFGTEFALRLAPFFDPEYRTAAERRPQPSTLGEPALFHLGKARLYELGQRIDVAKTYYDSARIALEGRDEPEYHSLLGLAYAGLGRKQDAVREGRRAVELLPTARDALAGPGLVENLAEIYARVGDQESAIEQLGSLLTVPATFSAALLRIDPRWDPLRGHRRFQELVRER